MNNNNNNNNSNNSNSVNGVNGNSVNGVNSSIVELIGGNTLCSNVVSLPNPNVSFFQKQYNSKDPFLKYNEGILNFNHFSLDSVEKVITVNIDPNKGDLLTNLYMELSIVGNPDMNQFIRGFAVGLIKSMCIDIGGVKVETLDANIINIYNELWLTDIKRQYNDYLVGNKINKGQKTFIVKLPFFFSKSYSKALPLCALYCHKISLKIELHPINNIIKSDYTPFNMDNMDNITTDMNNTTLDNNTNANNTNTNTNNEKMINYDNNYKFNITISGEFIKLDEEEKHEFMSKCLEYVIECYSHAFYNINNGNNNLTINSEYTVNEWFFLFQYSNKKPENNEYLKYVSMDNSDLNIDINGHKRFDYSTIEYFLIEENINNHVNVPRTKQNIPVLDNNILTTFQNKYGNINTEDVNKKLQKCITHIEIDEQQYLYTYTHSLNTNEEKNEYRGALNCKRYDRLVLQINNRNTPIKNSNGESLGLNLYSKYYSVLRINKGMAGVTY